MASTTIKENAKLFPTGTVIFREVAPAGRPASTTTRCLPRRGTTRPADPPHECAPLLLTGRPVGLLLPDHFGPSPPDHEATTRAI